MSVPPSSSSDSESNASSDTAAFKPDNGLGLSNPSLSQGRRLMLDLVNRLHNTGVQIDIDLPQIAVIGSQSAGKSSLIESISGITLPRAAGTCTRCPTECRLTRFEGPWQCTVDLHFITDKNGQSLGQPRNESFGEPIFDKSGVEERIRRAQRAVLNPSKPVRSFLEDEDDGDVSEVSFSTNYISLQISGPDLADLSFVDLPASAAAGRNERDIAMIKSIVTSYISKPSCVILLTVACESEGLDTFHCAYHLTKEYDPEGKRTIGVLTKPDRIPRGEEENWLPLICNEQETLENNWYCVKQLGSQDLKDGITWEEARAREIDFFTLKTRAGLQKLPKLPSSDPVNKIASLLHQFIGDLNNILKGVSNIQGLLQAILPAQERFRRQIRQTAPDFRPCKTTEEISPFAFLSNEDNELSSNEKTAPIFIDTVMDRAHAAWTRELPGRFPFSVQKSFIDEFTAKWAAPAQLLCRTIHTTLAQHATALVIFRSSGSRAVLIQDYMNQRTEAAQELIAKLIALETDGPLTLNEHYLADYKTKFLSQYKSARESKHNPILADAITAFKPSQTPPKDQSGNPKLTGIAQALNGLTGIGLRAVTAKDLVKLLPPDRMDAALNIMADVRAYFHVTYKRIADNVPLAIDHELVPGVGRDLLPALYRGLGVNGPDGTRICCEFAQENPSVAGKREESVKRLERLESASRELVHVGL
ncbi:P-loop containing nucleoside triphosphate hydrolase protein [Mycena galopus ATCC 62051]|nr:P-loop containing nucleoside triphosphate hydrolase protein [Mycena galopus ATCC 62051]